MNTRLKFKGTPYQYGKMFLGYEELCREQRCIERFYLRSQDRLNAHSTPVRTEISVPSSKGETRRADLTGFYCGCVGYLNRAVRRARDTKRKRFETCQVL